ALAELRRERFKGAFAWCTFDYAAHLWTQPPFAANEHERYFGLWRADGSAKPALRAWRASRLDVAEEPQSAGPRGTSWIDIEQERFWRSPARELRRLYRRFVALQG